MLKFLILTDLHHPPPIMPTPICPSCPTLLGGMGAYTHPPMNTPTTHPTTTHPPYMHPPYEPSNYLSHNHPHHHTPTHPMNPPITHPITTHPMNPSATNPMNPPTTPLLPTSHPMSHPKYMYSDRATLDEWVGVHKMKYYDIITVRVWVSICTVIVTLWMFDGWVGVHKMKFFDIVTVHGWVSICTHPMNSLTTHPTMHPTTNHTTTHPPTP